MQGSESNLPVTLPLWLAALAPIVVLLLLLVWRRWSTSAAAPVTLAAAVAIAIWLFRTPAETLAAASGKGIWDAIFILYVIWPALILYNVGNDAGAFGVIQRGIRRLMPDRLLVVLTFSWLLASFVQSIAGFGTPLAVTAPLLIGLGVKPLYAVLLPLIGRAWGNMFGSLGVTWFATLTIVDIADPTTTLLYTAALLWIPDLLAGLAIAWMYGGWWAIKRGAPAIAVVSLIHGGVQMGLITFLPALANFIASALALGAAFLLTRWSFYRQEDEEAEPDRIFTDEAKNAALEERQGEGEAGQQPASRKATAPEMSLFLAFAPYIVLTVLAVVALLITPVRDFLEQIQLGLPFPATTTGYDVQREAVDSYASFAPLTHPGTLLLISALSGYLLYRARGHYPKGVSAGGILARAANDALPATTALVGLLLISKVMDHTGMITVLALGVAEVAPTVVFVAASNFIGILGALITSSNTASNLLFAPLQATAAEVEGVSVPLAVAAQSAGGATGNAIAPSDALMGATIAGIPESLGNILAKALPWTILAGLLISAASVAIHFLF
ncbi:MAG: L-lactate permease [Anaerolineae bacterium]|jgi:lactate permease|nr:L-lactate permease [Anaerolineae bacterium]